MPNTLAELGKKTLEPDANIIKLPNISASVAQLKACVKELQERATPFPIIPNSRATTKKGAQGPLRQSASAPLSTRCCARATPTAAAPGAVKNYARSIPIPWANGSSGRRPTARTCTAATSITAKSQ